MAKVQMIKNRFSTKLYFTILVGLWLMQCATMYGCYWFGHEYYITGELPGLILSILMFWLSIKSYTLRLDYKKSFGYMIERAIKDNPMNKLNRRNRRKAYFGRIKK